MPDDAPALGKIETVRIEGEIAAMKQFIDEETFKPGFGEFLRR